MESNTKLNNYILLSLYTLIVIGVQQLSAQQHSPVNEPPIPVYFISQNPEDSLKATTGSTTDISKKYDTLEMRVNKSAAETTIHFTWLYMFIAILGLMNFTLLYFVVRLRKSLSDIKHLEHQIKLISLERETVINQEPVQPQLFPEQAVESKHKPVRKKLVKRTRK